VSPPQEPEDEPVGEEISGERADEPDGRSDGRSDDLSDEDALWRSIVDNYGDRPELEEPETEVPPSPRDLDLPARDEAPGTPNHVDPEEHYVPPPPPPLPTPPPARLLGWLGLFGVPMFVLVALVAHLELPSWLGLILMVWFVGGFVFLVASMSPGPGEDHDDGARL
jgi:hypothetical protein